MVAVPPTVGIVLGGPAVIHLPLLALWWTGYFFFYAGGQYLRSHGKARYLPPVRAYGIATAALGALVLLLEPILAVWVVPYLPLVLATSALSWRRLDRSMRNDTVTVVAAGLMTAVAFHAATLSFADPRWPWVWVCTALVTVYFLGTVFYVKTNIRERDSVGWLVASIAFHGLLTVAALALGATRLDIAGHTVPLAHGLVWMILTARAGAVPILRARPGSRLGAMSAKRLAMVIGLGEVVFSILVPLTLLAG